MRGFKDNIPPVSYKFQCVKKVFEKICDKFAVDLVELPLVEDAELYFRTSGEESDVCNKELFEVRKYKGEFENWVLRPEGTASCVRAIKESHFLDERRVCRLGYYGPMFRYNRPQKGRYRQFNQAGLEWLGIASPMIDLEIILCACELLDILNVQYVLELNSIGNLFDRQVYRNVLRDYFQITEDPLKKLDKLEDFNNVPQMQLNIEDQQAMQFVFNELAKRKINFVHNPYLVRGLDYYNGIVFEFKYQGQTVLGGGRYDGLMQQLGGVYTPAVGFALGVDRIVDVLDDLCIDQDFCLISLNEDEYAYAVLEKARHLDLKVLPLWGFELKKGLKVASKYSKYVVIIGENERKHNNILVKNLETGEQKHVLFDFKVFEFLKKNF